MLTHAAIITDHNASRLAATPSHCRDGPELRSSVGDPLQTKQHPLYLYYCDRDLRMFPSTAEKV